MKKYSGLWIDHKKAVLVTVADGMEEKKQILSNTEKNVRFSGGHRSKTPYGAYRGSYESTQGRRFTNNLNRFYDEVIETVHDSASVLIFGPGEAKGEIEKRLKARKFPGQIISIETADKMTDRQVSEKIQEHFQITGKRTPAASAA
jgi:hypothetical protein